MLKGEVHRLEGRVRLTKGKAHSLKGKALSSMGKAHSLEGKVLRSKGRQRDSEGNQAAQKGNVPDMKGNSLGVRGNTKIPAQQSLPQRLLHHHLVTWHPNTAVGKHMKARSAHIIAQMTVKLEPSTHSMQIMHRATQQGSMTTYRRVDSRWQVMGNREGYVLGKRGGQGGCKPGRRRLHRPCRCCRLPYSPPA